MRAVRHPMAGDWFRIRRILTASAKRLALGGQRDDNFGSGLIDLLKALQLADLRAAMTALRQGSDKHLLEEEQVGRSHS